MSDNFHFDMTSGGHEKLRTAMGLFEPPGQKATGYRVDKDKGLVFYWTKSERASELPFPMTLEQAADFAWGWLQHADYGSQPDHDGDNGKGWRLYCESWGQVGEYSAFAAVQPVWLEYGK